MSEALVSLLFLISGAVGLVYEVLWLRQATTVFGASAPAAAATLSAFFLGTAAGSLALARRAPRVTRPLRAFGLLELGVGGAALLVGPVFGLYARLYPLLHRTFATSPGAFVLAKTALALAAFFLPAFFMGGTLPVLAASRSGRRTASLYGLNTLGAAAGALAVPYALLPALGAGGALAAAVLTSALVGAVALVLDRAAAPVAPRTGDMAAPAPPGGGLGLGLGLAFVSGALTIGLETLSVRMLALVHENSVHAFAWVVALFLLGLALGAGLARVLLGRVRRARAALAFLWLAGGLLVGCAPRVFVALTHGLEYAPGTSVALRAAPLLLAMTALAGGVLPMLLGAAAMDDARASARGARPDPRRSAALGRILAANTLGAIVGPLAVSFVLAPRLGLWSTFGAIALAMIAASAAAGGTRRWVAAAAAGVAAALLLVPRHLPGVRLASEHGERIVALREGAFGTVATIEDDDGDRRLKVDNFYLLGGTASLELERAQGHLPLLLHPAPRRVAYLGLGTGISAGAALLHATDAIVAVELIPEVVSAARADFAGSNLGVAASPRVEIVVDDARSFLAGSGRRFDVIVGDLLVPWRPGEAALYTAEAFAASRRALAPGGLFCQWAPLYQLSEEELRILVATFSDVFPAATLWRGDFGADGPAIALCGEGDGYRFDPDRVDRAVGEAAPRLAGSAPLLATPAGLWMHLVARIEPGEPGGAGARRNRDATPWLELLTPAARTPHPAGTGEAPGARLERWLADRSPAAEDTLHALLGPDRSLWHDAGRTLGRGAVEAAAGRSEEAQALAREAFAALPDETREAFLAGFRGR